LRWDLTVPIHPHGATSFQDLDGLSGALGIGRDHDELTITMKRGHAGVDDMGK